ncbi:MAG: GNAT family N-acetyltransferase [Oscillospiraceae bacterium]|nr:GNAT family N-acetyltransferase [Oscillospiraceae bacterium]
MARVVDSAWRTSYKDVFSPEQIAAYTGEYRRRSFTELIESGRDVFVLLADGEAAAVCAAQTCTEKPFEGYAEIMLLYVDPEWQRKGMGKKLLSHTLRKMRGKGYKSAVLDTAELNTPARRFYEKFGFTERKTPVSRKLDDVTMVIYTIDF